MLLTGESKEHWGRESKGKQTDRWQTESQVGPCSSGGVGEFQHPGPAATTATGSGTVARQVDCRDLKEGRICTVLILMYFQNPTRKTTI